MAKSGVTDSLYRYLPCGDDERGVFANLAVKRRDDSRISP
jgi:hypothetical protein